MSRMFLVEEVGAVTYSRYEASLLAEGTPIISGTFKESTSAWTGIFTADDGQVYEINEGYIKKGAA